MIALLFVAGTLALPNHLPFGPSASDRCPGQGKMMTSSPENPYGPTPALLLRPQDRAKVRFQRLGELPKANYEIAVMRTVGGCARPVVVRYAVGP